MPTEQSLRLKSAVLNGFREAAELEVARDVLGERFAFSKQTHSKSNTVAVAMPQDDPHTARALGLADEKAIRELADRLAAA